MSLLLCNLLALCYVPILVILFPLLQRERLALEGGTRVAKQPQLLSNTLQMLESVLQDGMITNGSLLTGKDRSEGSDHWRNIARGHAAWVETEKCIYIYVYIYIYCPVNDGPRQYIFNSCLHFPDL